MYKAAPGAEGQRRKKRRKKLYVIFWREGSNCLKMGGKRIELELLTQSHVKLSFCLNPVSPAQLLETKLRQENDRPQ
ncbi:MAG TPA: hypothetical protein DDW76_18770 [Cyanobacteria bacterium UBA11369]|nr:hypothetical protein [Cyanobacteria bacterium UBA11371]HBE30293.1 hypothetical protein [Cyanobacteria bacterium UBA11368]HBE50755.1 hypothetical protein [Cyanobacteria bacterium UBA11369]